REASEEPAGLEPEKYWPAWRPLPPVYPVEGEDSHPDRLQRMEVALGRHRWAPAAPVEGGPKEPRRAVEPCLAVAEGVRRAKEPATELDFPGPGFVEQPA